MSNGATTLASTRALGAGPGEAGGTPPTPVRWLVLDAGAITDVDSTGAAALENAFEDLHGRGVVFALARAAPPLPDLLQTYGLLEKIGPHRLYPTDRDAVAAFRRETGLPAGPAAGDGAGEGHPVVT